MLNKNYKLFLALITCTILNSQNIVADDAVKTDVQANEVKAENVPAVSVNESKNQSETDNNSGSAFDFDLKMKSINNAKSAIIQEPNNEINSINGEIEYKSSPIDELGNSILSKIDSDLFSQMSEIEKSTTLLTLELRREKLKNEIEAQKAIRQKAADELVRQKEEAALKDLEKKKQLEANIIREQQLLIDKQQLFEVFKQRKLLNSYMNQMLSDRQAWLKEKQSLYAEIDMVNGEKKNLISLFKTRIDSVLTASNKNKKIALEAKANFDRIVKNLKTKNEQLRKRIEADAIIIKENQKKFSQNAIKENSNSNLMPTTTTNSINENSEVIEQEQVKIPLSSKYAILGISGRSNNMIAEIIDIDEITSKLKLGSVLPTGHNVVEIGNDFIKFGKDSEYEYLFVGKGIDGITPTLGLTNTK